MKHPIFIKRFEYSIPDSDTAVNGTGSLSSYPFEMQLPLVKVNIDFEKGNLSLEGNSLLITDSALKSELAISTSARERIKVKATIYPGFRIDLSDFTNDSLVFSLEGIIDDGKIINTCSGLLVLDSMTNGNGPAGREWWLTVYLYDDYNDEREIKLRLTMYSISENAQLN